MESNIQNVLFIKIKDVFHICYQITALKNVNNSLMMTDFK